MKPWLLALAVVTATSSASRAVAAPHPARVQAPQSCLPSALSLSKEVLPLLKENDTVALSRYVAPEWGVRFSPEVHVSDGDVQIAQNFVATLKTNKKPRIWGSYDGSGDPITLSWADYRKKFVWPRDFTARNARVAVNSTPLGTSNTLNNLRDFYPKDIHVEFYLPPTGRDRLDWASLWLIWRPTGKTWRLIGIAHNEWTV